MSWGAGRVILDEKANGMWQRFFLIKSSAPSSAELQRLTDPVVKGTSFRFRRLVVGSSEVSLLDASHKTGMYDAGLEGNLRQRQKTPRVGQFQLEVICFDGDCLQRSRNSSGVIAQQVLSGRNPLELHIKDKVLTIVYVEGNLELKWLNFFGRIENGTLEDARAVLAELAKKENGFSVSLTLRTDSYFFDSDAVPSSLLLWTEDYPKTLDDYRARQFFMCGSWQPGGFTECRVWGY
jgi:hypothetical protein